MTCCFFHNGIYMPKRLIFPSDLSACSQTPCPSAFRLKDMHCEMFQPENILQKNQFPKNWKNTGPAEGFQSRLKDSRAQFFSRKADRQGICEQAERFEGFFKVLYIEYYERPYLTEKSKISSWNMYVVLLCSETYLTLSTKISYFSLQQYRPHCRQAKTIIPKLIANRGASKPLSLFQRHIFQFFQHILVCRTNNAFSFKIQLLIAVCAPPHDTSHRKQRCKYFLWQTNHFIYET